MNEDKIQENFERMRDHAYSLFDEAVKPGGIRKVAEELGISISVQMEAHGGVNKSMLMNEIASIAFQADRNMEWIILEEFGLGRPDVILTGYTVNALYG